jgi:3'-5' exoribonuclease
MESKSAKRAYIADLKAGNSVDELFVLADRAVASKRNGDPFINLVLADKTGRVKGVAWDQVERILEAAAVGDVVQVGGVVTEYRSEIQVVVKSLTPVALDAVDPADFLPVTDRDIDSMFESLVRLTTGMQSDDLRQLLEAFWADEDFVGRFKKAPAAKHMHHAYIGGLLEHCLSMASLADKVGRHYAGIDRDLLMAGAVLHDIGKIREFDYAVRIDYSDEGRFISHIVIGVEMLDEKLRALASFSDERARLLKHMIVSHHGTREFGSPEPPKTIEAMLLNYIDEIDSKVNGIRRFMAEADPDAAWTAYHRVWGRHFYTGPPTAEEG